MKSTFRFPARSRKPSATRDPMNHDWYDTGTRTEIGDPITRCYGCGAAKHWEIAKRWCRGAPRGVGA